MGSINSYKTYREYFGFSLTEGTPSTGIVYAIYTIGNIVGSFASGPATDRWGRKWGMFIGATIIVIGTCIQAPSINLAQFMIGRFILGFGVAITASAGPAYASEMAHPSYRGLMTGIYNTWWFMGGVPGTWIPYGTSTIASDNSWRIPIWCQMFYSGLVVLAAPWLPETPRWLMANDRHEEALEVMAKYHGEGSRDSPIVQLEYKEMLEEISVTGADKRWWDYRELFNTPDVRYRSMLVVAVAFISQWSGNGPVSYYYPQMLAGAGITSNHKQLLLQGFQSVVSFVGATIGAIYTDRWGRRPMWLVSVAIAIVIFILVISLNATNLVTGPDGKITSKNPAQANAEIAFIFIYGFAISCGQTPLQALYPVEVLKYESRAKGMGMYNFATNIALFYNTFVTGIAFSGAGWKYYFLFIFWDMAEWVFIYFLFVETKNRTLEELAEIFKGRNRRQRSLEKKQVVLHGDEGVTEVFDKEKELEA